jgi:secreted PhoX family phosphatase
LRRLILTAASIAALTCATLGPALAAPSLAERRAITDYQNQNFPDHQKKIQQAAGFEVPVEVDWNSLALPGDEKYYAQDDYFVKTIFQPVEDALSGITKDDMGKQALKEKLKKIAIRYGDDGISASDYSDRVKFEDGVLTVNFKPYTNTADVKDRTDTITKLLEASL